MRRLALTSLALISTLGCAARIDLPVPPRKAARAPVAVAAAVAPSANANDVAAEVVGKKITFGELDADIADQLASAKAAYEMSLYEARKGALDKRIDDAMLDAEAGKRGVSVEALLAAEIDGKLTTPSEAEAQALYEQFKDQMDGASFDMMKPRILEHLSQEKRGTRQRDFFAELKKTYGAKLLLEPPRIAVDATGPARGPADAKITVLIYSDFECPFCARAEPTLAKVRETYGKDVKFVFRHYPLPFHAAARPAAAATACANEQGLFWQLHDHLFETGELGADAMRTFLGQQSGFDGAKFDECLSAGRGEAVVAADMASAGLVQVDSTPHFFINGVRLSGAQPFEAFAAIIDTELAR